MSTGDQHCCDVEEAPSGEQPQKWMYQCLSCLAYVLIIILVGFFLVFAGVLWLLSGFNLISILGSEETSQASTSGSQEFYKRVKDVEGKTKKLAERVKFIHGRLVILVLTWLIVNLCVDPRLKNKLVLGSELWKWTLLVSLILCGYSFISLASTNLLRLLRCCNKFKTDPNAEYYATGLRRSANFVVLSSSVLLTWIFYFKTSHGIRKTPETEGLLHMGTWTFVTAAVATLLWLIKNVLLLMWEADVVYNRFRERILSVRLHQFFLGHMCEYEDKKRLDVFRPELSDERQPTTFEIQRMAEYFIALSVTSSTSRDDDGTLQVSAKCDEFLPSKTGVGEEEITTVLSKLLKLEDDQDKKPSEEDKKPSEPDKKSMYAKLFLLDLKRELQLEESENISYENCAISMIKAQKNCLALGYSLSDAKDVVKVLNKVMTAVLVAIIIIAWLLLTDIATNKILVLIASPFLAATFIFGEACKKTFEGIMFSFINHPFNVGDLCIIDDNELEVKRMGILTTTFILIGKKRKVLYPNSILATKSIINLKEKPDPNDHVELKLPNGISTKKYKKLEGKIKGFLKSTTTSFTAITLEDIGDDTKMVIQYQLRMSVQSATHSQCLEKKREQKSVLLKQIAKFMEDVGVVAATDDPPPTVAPRLNMTAEIKPSNT